MLNPLIPVIPAEEGDIAAKIWMGNKSWADYIGFSENEIEEYVDYFYENDGGDSEMWWGFNWQFYYEFYRHISIEYQFQ